ncbi:ATP-grasp fold amidoligase family protein [Prevotella disiens]|nr:ATP-grasp fold amidoligase family protein [Prevotella disiens]
MLNLRRIIVEELLEDTEQKKLSSSLIDYKIWCFNGTPYIAFVCYDRHRKADGNIGVTYDLFSLDTWEHKGDFLSKKDANYKKIPKPQCLQEMLQIAKKLSEDFPLVRVDFYIINNKPYFGELTFTSAGGLNYFYSELGQITMGKAINLSNVKRIR